MAKRKLPSLEELEFNRLSAQSRKTAIAYVQHRVRELKKARTGARKDKHFWVSIDFIDGRECEAQHTLGMLKHAFKK